MRPGALLRFLVPLFLVSTVVYGVMLNTMQLLFSILFIPISRVLYLKTTAPLVKILGTMFVWFLEWGGRCHIRVHSEGTAAALMEDYSAISTYNHVGSIDWLVLSWVTCRFNKIGVLRCLAKLSIVLLPVLGWTMWFCDFIFLRRDIAKDKKALQSGVKHVRKTYKGDAFGRVPFHVVLFPEGTRSTPEKMQQSIEFQKAKGLEPMEHVMYPRMKGFLQLWDGLGDQCDRFVDVTIGYPEGCPSLLGLLRGVEKPWEIHVLVKSTPKEELKVIEEKGEMESFLVDVFKQKDEALKYYHKNGTFSQPELFPDEGRMVWHNVQAWIVVLVTQSLILSLLYLLPTATPFYGMIAFYAVVCTLHAILG